MVLRINLRRTQVIYQNWSKFGSRSSLSLCYRMVSYTCVTAHTTSPSGWHMVGVPMAHQENPNYVIRSNLDLMDRPPSSPLQSYRQYPTTIKRDVQRGPRRRPQNLPPTPTRSSFNLLSAISAILYYIVPVFPSSSSFLICTITKTKNSIIHLLHCLAQLLRHHDHTRLWTSPDTLHTSRTPTQ